jgi:nitroreductase
VDLYSAIYARQTIRDFQPRPIDQAILDKIIQAGFAAPTNNHMREWHFVILQDRPKRRELLEKVIHPTTTKGATAIVNRWGLTDECQRELYINAIPKQFSMLDEAPALILPFYQQPGALLKPKSQSDLNAFASIWLCVENMLLAAAAEGIFGVTRIPFADERKIVLEALNIPAGFEFPCWLALGYPADDAKRAEQVQIDPLTRIHMDTW